MSLDTSPKQMVRKLLQEEIEAAQRRRDDALERFETLISGGVPQDVSHPEYVARIQAASREYSQAIREATEASDRLNRFLLADRGDLKG